MSDRDYGYRRTCFDAHGKVCANCGTTEVVEAHHRNGDRTENGAENLLPLCNRCHQQLHREGLNGWEDELKPPEERQHIDHSKTRVKVRTTRKKWEAWKRTIPRRKSIEKRLKELIREDMERDTDE